jgi:two-component system alkaline phosphatase synthesis response regulator PhoP
MRKKIWIVDDEPAIAHSLREILEGEGYEVTASLDAAPLERLLTDEATAPDLLLLDVRLHAHDGAELARRLKRRRRTRHLPIILMSAQPQPPAAQADVFLAKPFSLRTLLALVASFTGATAPHPAGPHAVGL